MARAGPLIKYLCARGGSCSFTNGDLNIVIQSSTDRGRTFGSIWHVSPDFPAGGADSGPLVVEPDGRIDLLYQGYTVIDRATDKLGPASTYFTSSTDGGRTWTAPVRVGAAAGTMSPAEWWVDGDVAIDSAGNLYATWDTQNTTASGGSTDASWLAYSTDRGRRWSAPIRASPDWTAAPHITEVAGGRPGFAFVAWIASSDQRGYAPYIRTFSINTGGGLPPPGCRARSTIRPYGRATRSASPSCQFTISSSAGEAHRSAPPRCLTSQRPMSR